MADRCAASVNACPRDQIIWFVSAKDAGGSHVGYRKYAATKDEWRRISRGLNDVVN
jgi:deferrochelatase/peroxidase EfeB